MKINTKATNLSVTPSISEYLDKRLSSLQKFIDPRDTSVMCDVEIAKTTRHHKGGDLFKAEINLHVGGKNLFAVSEKETLNAAIDEVRDEIAHSLSSYRTKKVTLIRKGASRMKDMLKGFWWKRR